MQKNKNLLNFWQENDIAKTDLESAQDRFREKTYYEKYLSIRKLARITRKLLPVVSIVTGSMSLAILFKLFIPPLWLCLALALPVLALWESGKSRVLMVASERFLSGGLPVFLVLLCAALISGSAYFSFNGAKELSTMLDDTKERYQESYASNKDSIEIHYSSQIEAVKTRIDAIESNKDSRWGGLLSGGENQQIINYQNEISQLSKDKETALQFLSIGNKESIQEAKMQFDNNLYTVLIVILAIELIIIISNVYDIYFDYKINIEHELIQTNLNAPLTFTTSQLQSFFQGVIMPNIQALTAPLNSQPNETPQIGFNTALNNALNNKTQVKNSKEDLDDNKPIMKDGINISLMQDIASGNRDYRELMKRNKCNPRTVTEYLKKYDNNEFKDYLKAK